MSTFYKDENIELYHGLALEVLKSLPAAYVDCVMTSPPYWGLRDYGYLGQLGLEKTFPEYIDKLCNIFDEIKRILKETGTCWVNLGDTYANTSTGGQGATGGRDKSTLMSKMSPIGTTPTKRKKQNVPQKCLCQIPSRFAIEMTNRSWILRNEIIWHKPNCMPSSASDRFTVDFEKLFFFVKNKKYYFEQQFDCHLTQENRPHGIVRDRIYDYDSKQKIITGRTAKGGDGSGELGNSVRFGDSSLGRNKRCVWKINTNPFPESHFAVYPEELCEIPIKAGCPGKGIVLDPFHGSGTTGKVARKLGREYIGIDIKKEYLEMSIKTRLKDRYLDL